MILDDCGLLLPAVIACKVSSESAGYVSVAPVARVELASEDLIRRILGICGKDPDRIARILSRGSLVSEDTRFRWQGFEVSLEELSRILNNYPDSDPSREFNPAACDFIVFRNQRGDLKLTREIGSERRFLKKSSFWDLLLELASTESPGYERYSYADKADVFTLESSGDSCSRVRELCSLLRYRALIIRIRRMNVITLNFYLHRE